MKATDDWDARMRQTALRHPKTAAMAGQPPHKRHQRLVRVQEQGPLHGRRVSDVVTFDQHRLGWFWHVSCALLAAAGHSVPAHLLPAGVGEALEARAERLLGDVGDPDPAATGTFVELTARALAEAGIVPAGRHAFRAATAEEAARAVG